MYVVAMGVLLSALYAFSGIAPRCQSTFIFFFKQKTAYEIRPRDWSSDVCSSDHQLFELEVDGDVRRVTNKTAHCARTFPYLFLE